VLGAIMVVGFWAALALAALVLGGREAPGDWTPGATSRAPGATSRAPGATSRR